jgi:hypothetical protein
MRWRPCWRPQYTEYFRQLIFEVARSFDGLEQSSRALALDAVAALDDVIVGQFSFASNAMP